MLATLTVSTNTDTNSSPINDGILEFREAIAYVNGTTPGTADRNAWIDETVDGLGVNDTIVFAPGLSGDIDLTQGKIDIRSSVTITGQVDDHGNNKITIDGQQLSSVFFITGIANNVSISNLNFKRGAGDGLSQGEAGAINISGATVSLDHLAFDLNEGKHGGAINSIGSSVVIHDCLFTGNKADIEGGAIYASANDITRPLSVTITDSRFSGNHAEYNGGALSIVEQYDHSTVSIERSIVESNTANIDGGGLYLQNGDGRYATGGIWGGQAGHFSLTDSIISGNHAGNSNNGRYVNYGSGGGMFLRFKQQMTQGPGWAGLAGGSVVLERNQVSDNHAYLSGGGIKIEAGYYTYPAPQTPVVLRIQDTTISGNTSRGSSSEDSRYHISSDAIGGGGIALDVEYAPAGWRAEIINATVSGNKSRNGGGMQLSGPVSVEHSTITLNEAGHISLPEYDVPSRYRTTSGGVSIPIC